MRTVRAFLDALRVGKYADGGYPTFILATPDVVLCHDCARNLVWEIARNTRDDGKLAFAALGINWECPDLYCDECNERIESAYADDDADDADASDTNCAMVP